jgi:hypothetical protein
MIDFQFFTLPLFRIFFTKKIKPLTPEGEQDVKVQTFSHITLNSLLGAGSKKIEKNEKNYFILAYFSYAFSIFL